MAQHENEYVCSGTSPSPDFSVRDEGTILLLIPHTESARNWVHENVGRDNGYQPLYPTIVIEPRYFLPILEGLHEAGFEVRP